MFKNYPFLYILIGLWISVIGAGIYRVASVWMLSGDGVGSVVAFGIAGTLPLALLGLISGALVDKYNKLKILLYSDLLRMIVVLLSFITLLYLPNPIIIIISNMLITIFGLPYHPALASWIPSVSEDNQAMRTKLNSHLFMTLGIGQFIGPAIGGWIAANVGVQLALIINTLTFGIGVILTFLAIKHFSSRYDVVGNENRMNISRPAVNKTLINIIKNIPSHIVGNFKGIRDGFKYLVSVKFILFFVVAFPFIEAVESIFPLALPVSLRETNLNASYYGLLMSTLGLTMVLGTIVARFKFIATRTEGFLSVNFLLQAFGMLLIAMGWPNIYWAFLGLCFIGIPSGIAQVTFASFMQRTVPREYLGRMFGTIHSFAAFLQPIAPLAIIPFTITDSISSIYWFLAITMGLCGILAFIGMRKAISRQNNTFSKGNIQYEK